MKFVFHLVAGLILLLSVNCTNLRDCPSSCDCPGFTFSCMDCIRHFHRGITTQSGGCVCLPYFQEKIIQQPYCCPMNCTTCDISGCLTCADNFQIYYNSHFQIFICVCKPTYTNFLIGICYCMSYIAPELFYFNQATNVCHKCPPGCICNSSGCISCQDPLRYIVVDSLMRSVCPCRYPTKQNQTSCVCPKDCQCNNGRITCNASSNRDVENGLWNCKHPYVQENFECKCNSPYFILEIIPGIKECVCGSRAKISNFYQYGEKCYSCPKGCVCNEKGCVSCDDDAHRTIQGFSCFCTVPYQEFQGLCICIQPYFLDPMTGICNCISEYRPMNYTYNHQEQDCGFCPALCVCNQQGCVQCHQTTMRTVRKLSNGRFICDCPSSAFQILTLCGCNAYSYMKNYTCVCYQNSSIYNDSGVCKPCPAGCTCNISAGCHTCNSTSFRIPVVQDGDYSNCPCLEGYQQNSDFLCVCKFPYVWSTVTNACVCPQPYQYNTSSGCVCRSVNDPTKYYVDALTKKCHICPVGCTCNVTGCHNCYPYSLRVNILYQSTYGRCPCVQNSTLFEDVCTICPSNSYFFKGICVECQGCSKCNINGCTACSLDSQLELVGNRNTCKCNDANKIFVRDKCKCGKDLYENTTTSLCLACPKYCLDCRMNSSSSIECITCVNVPSRRNSPLNNCPCIDGFSDIGAQVPYCCPDTCSDCNQTGCTACPPETFRILVNQSCNCEGNLIQAEGSAVCTCKYGEYMYLNQCLECPPNCPSCVYSFTTETVNCLECQQGVNRKNHSGSLTTFGRCQCEDLFAEPDPQQEFCYPKNCKKQTKICQECSQLREVVNSGLQCRCIKGYYESELEECEPCAMDGCLACLSLDYCISCNESQDYYLTNKTCKKNVAPEQAIYIQDLEGIYLQIKISSASKINATKYPVLYYYTARIEKVRKNNDMTTPSYNDFEVYTKQISLSDDSQILHMIIENPAINYENIIIHINLAFATTGAQPIMSNKSSRRELVWYFSIFDNKNKTYEGIDDDVYIFKDKIYSSEVLGLQYQWAAQAQIIISITFMVFALVLHLLSFKNNSIVFFLQTMTFIGFVYNDPNLEIAPFLFNMRLSYLQVSTTSDTIKILNQKYLESAEGNFKYFTLDSNLLRVAGLLIEIALILIIIAGCFRILILVYECKKQTWIKPGVYVKILKRPIYRAIEFFYKLTMYPILFFSIVNLHNWNAYTIIPGAQYYHNLTRGISIGFLILYAGITLFSVIFQTISKVYKIQNATEFLSDVISSVILVSSYNQNVFICLIIIFMVRAALYLYLRKKYFREFSKLEYLRILSLIFEICSVCLVTENSIELLSSFILLVLVSHTIHSSISVGLSIKKWKILHKGIKFTEEKDPGSQNISDIKITTQSKSQTPEDLTNNTPA